MSAGSRSRTTTRDTARTTLALWVSAAMLAACVPTTGGWDLGALEARHVTLASSGLRGHRLGDLAPHFLPESLVNGDPSSAEHEPSRALSFFLCRFDARAPLGWEWSGAVEPSRAVEMRRAVTAVANSVPGLRLEEVDDDGAISIELVEGDSLPRTGRASADCRVRVSAGTGEVASHFDAALDTASIRLLTSRPDGLGRMVALSEEEFVGALVHELGHALGFGAHTATRDDPLSLSIDGARWAGRRVSSGKSFENRTLAALYAVPSGTIVSRGTMTAASARWVARLSRRARDSGWQGPFTRVGDRSGELFWKTDSGERLALWAPRPDAQWPEPLVLVPNQAARRLLAEPIRREP